VPTDVPVAVLYATPQSEKQKEAFYEFQGICEKLGATLHEQREVEVIGRMARELAFPTTGLGRDGLQ
jgi:hypothetical protein